MRCARCDVQTQKYKITKKAFCQNSGKLEEAMLLASERTEVNAPAKAAAQRAVIAIDRRRPGMGVLTRSTAVGVEH